MDKLSEHAIRMLEIADKPYRTENVINANLQDRHDMAQAVYDLILQVQMLKMAKRKTENCSEKPNNSLDKDCETCKWGDWYRNGYDITTMDDECGGCCSWNNKWAPKTEPQTDEEYINNLPWTEVGNGEQTDEEITELAKAIVHKMIDNGDIAEEAYPDLRQRMHEAVERLDEYYPSEDERSE